MTKTYRGRSLDELLPEIRRELGDDAVILDRREAYEGGVGGFFQRRLMEVDAAPARQASVFREELHAAFGREEAQPPAPEPAAPPPPAPAHRPHVDEQVADLPEPERTAAIGVDDIFPARPAAGGLASLFAAGAGSPAEPEPVPAPQSQPQHQSQPEPQVQAQAPGPAPAPSPPPAAAAPQPEPVAAEAAVEFPQRSVRAPAPVGPAVPPLSGPAEAGPLRDGLVTRGLPAELATEIVEEAVGSLLPFAGDRGLRPLVVEALARRIPVAPLSRGGRVVTFVGPGGAGKTRCVAKLAAAHARTGMQPVAAVALRPPDQGAELARLLAPHGVAMHAVEDAGEAADRIARLRGQALVLLDTPGVSPRSEAGLRALAAELRRIAPDEVHLTVPATMGADAARELVDGAAPLGVRALALTHTDETGQLGTGVGLAMSTGLPLSWLARGEAVEGGLRPVAAGELADTLVP